MKVYMVVLNWNGRDMLEACLKSLQSQTCSNEIIVVDNGSTDSSVELIESKFPNIHLMKQSKNHGFAGGVNIGIKYAMKNDADAVALFNNDAVADKSWLENLVSILESSPDTGIVACKLLRSDGKFFDSTGDFYSSRGIPFPRGRNQEDKKQFEKTEEVFGASGGASLYRTRMLNEIGMFDERFFAYFEDVDISFRAQLASWKIIYQPNSIAYHEVGATSSRLGDFSRYHSIKNFLILYTKNMPTALYWKYLPLFLYQFTRTTVRSIIDMKLGIWFRAVFAFISSLPGILKDRKIIQKSRKVSTKYIGSILYKARPPKIPKI